MKKTKLFKILLVIILLFSYFGPVAEAAVPDKAFTRSEFAVMLRDMLDIHIEYFKEPVSKDYFDDIRQDAPYTSAVIDLVTANIFEKGGNFNPESTLTREEMIHYIMRAYQYKMGDNYAMIKIGQATFKDVKKISSEYSGEVARAQHDKLILGYSNHTFGPKKTATKAAAKVVIKRLVDLLDQQNSQITVKPEAVMKDNSIEMKLTVKNNTTYSAFIDQRNGQQFDFELLDADRNVLYTWSDDMAFTDALTTTEIGAGKTIKFYATLSGDEYKQIKDKIVYFKAYITGNAEFINTNGYEIKLK